MLKTLMALALCVGCGGADGNSGSAKGVDPVTNENAQGESIGDSLGLATAFTYTLPSDLQPRDVSGLEVVIEGLSPPASESYRIDLFALLPAKTKREKPVQIPLGGQDIFRPLKKGETTTIYLDAIPIKAWVTGKSGQELYLGFHIKPANPKREAPHVNIRMVDVKATLAK